MAMRAIGAAILAAMLAVELAPGAPCAPAFVQKPAFDVGTNYGMNALADFDGDGDLDLTTGVSIFLNDGTGVFSEDAIGINSRDRLAFAARAQDFDGDGRLDLAIGYFGKPYVTFVHGRDRAAGLIPFFDDPLTVPSVEDSWHMVSADFDEDGRLDVFVVSFMKLEATLILNDGARQYRPIAVGPLSTPALPIATGDFDGDGHSDVALGLNNQVSLLFGAGDGTFAEPVEGWLSVAGEPVTAHRFCCADFDRDGRSEFVAIGEAYLLVFSGASIDRGAGLPGSPALVASTEGAEGRFVEIADVNADGMLDIVMLAALAGDGGQVRILHGLAPVPPLSFAVGPPIAIPTGGHEAVLGLGDVNGDGAVDIVITTEGSGRGQVFLNDASCGREAARGDANADGWLDLADPIVALSYILSGASIPCPGATEVNGDGRLDIADPVYLLNYLFADGPSPLGASPVACGGTR
ncbi:MAG: VCBS repeat-containing protein [Planctomycetes bacterium]|nr:VCBS repeat-containing protein [Planctomycetota bacterium]